jgi:ABC-2 type transport system permease protein
MKPFIALLGLSFRQALYAMNMSNRFGKNAKRKKDKPKGMFSGLFPAFFLGFLMLFISFVYSIMFAALFAPAGALDFMLMLMLVIALFLSTIITLFAAGSMVFSVKDADFLMSLPLPAWQVMASRILALYLDILLMMECLLIPSALACGLFGGPWIVCATLPLLGVFLSLIPTLISLALGGLLSFAVAKLPFKNFFSTLFNLVILAAIMALSISFSFIGNYSGRALGGQQSLEAVLPMRDALVSSVPPLQFFAEGVMGKQLWHLPLIALICAAPFAALLWLLSHAYKPLLSALAATAVRSDYRLKGVSAGSPLGALLKKEAWRLFRTPGFMFNIGGIPILFIIACIVAVCNRAAVQEVVNEMNAGMGGAFLPMLPALLLLIEGFFISMCLISAVSISLEGKSFWLIKSAPLSTASIFTAKAGFNSIFSGLFSLITQACIGIAFGLPLSTVLAMTALCLLASVLFSLTGLVFNLRFPRLDAVNETVVIKQSASVMITMFVNWGVMLLLALLYAFTSGQGFLRFTLWAALSMAALSGLLIALLADWGRKAFARLTF